MHAFYKLTLMNTAELAQALKALAVPSRLRIIQLLQRHAYCVRALTMRLDISQPAVSQHLAVLRRAGLVSGEKHGTMVHYRVNTERLEQIRRALGCVGTEDAAKGSADVTAKVAAEVAGAGR